MIENLEVLRQAGFFKEYESLTDAEIIDILRIKRRLRYSEIFGYDYEPKDFSYITTLLSQDDKKFLDIDLEAGVLNGNNIYVSILESFAEASNGYFNPTAIEEKWETDEGPIVVSFLSNGQKIVFEPDYIDDWIDGEVFKIINAEMKKVTDEKFIVCSGPDDEWFGQNIIYIRLAQDEKDLLMNKLNWNFPEW